MMSFTIRFRFFFIGKDTQQAPKLHLSDLHCEERKKKTTLKFSNGRNAGIVWHLGVLMWVTRVSEQSF